MLAAQVTPEVLYCAKKAGVTHALNGAQVTPEVLYCAKEAGVTHVLNGAQVTPEVLYCAKKAGVTHVLKAGGAQAVAAMAWGTQSCPKVEPQAADPLSATAHSTPWFLQPVSGFALPVLGHAEADAASGMGSAPVMVHDRGAQELQPREQ